MLKNGEVQRAKNTKVIFFHQHVYILISMFNLITINLKYSYSFMYPVNVFQTSIKTFPWNMLKKWQESKQQKISIYHNINV